jgi:hypothetical protein
VPVVVDVCEEVEEEDWLDVVEEPVLAWEDEVVAAEVVEHF